MKKAACYSGAEINLEPVTRRKGGLKSLSNEEKDQTVEEDMDETAVKKLESNQLPNVTMANRVARKEKVANDKIAAFRAVGKGDGLEDEKNCRRRHREARYGFWRSIKRVLHIAAVFQRHGSTK